jgi:hypothetical protein
MQDKVLESIYWILHSKGLKNSAVALKSETGLRTGQYVRLAMPVLAAIEIEIEDQCGSETDTSEDVRNPYYVTYCRSLARMVLTSPIN